MTDIVIRTKLARYLALRDEANALKKEMEDVKAEMKPYLDKGRENAAGSKVLDLDTPLRNGEKDYSAVQYTRKSSKRLDEDFIKQYLKSVRGEDFTEAHLNVIKTVEVVDQDAWWDLYVQELIDEDTFKKSITETVTWAFTPISD